MASPYDGDIPLTTVVSQEPTALGLNGGDKGTTPQLFGLGPLQNAQKLMIRQRVRCKDICSACSGCEVEKKYTVHGDNGEIILWASETSSCGMRFCFGSGRSLNIRISDSTAKEVIRIDRPLNCAGCCCSWCYPRCTQELNVAMEGLQIGTIRERATWIYPVYHLFDTMGQQILKVRGPCCTAGCFSDVQFSVMNTDGVELATIVKKWMGCAQETLMDADNFMIEFKTDVDVRDKAMVMSTAFLIDLMYFDTDG
ncbi:phospholipid scramblase 1-like [Tigriopus californicus]|nr:phospholipid scramblase 1-like [Tigriopus californicus]